MSANDLTRDELIACLAWHVACGADEALGNRQTHDQIFIPLKSFLADPLAAKADGAKPDPVHHAPHRRRQNQHYLWLSLPQIS